MKRAINSASILSVLAKVPRLLPKASACAGGSCRVRTPAASKFAQSRHSWPPAASKQTKAFRPLASFLQLRMTFVRVRQAKLEVVGQAMDAEPIARDIRADDLWM